MAELNLSGYHPEMQKLLVIAKDLGWSITQKNAQRKGRGGARLRSPITGKTISIPQSTQMRAEIIKSLYSQVRHHSDPEAVTRLIAMLELGQDTDIPRHIREEWIRESVPSVMASVEGTAIEIEDQPIYRRPWLAKTGDDLYESSAVEEIVQGSTVIGYGCKVCDYEADEPQRVAAHYRNKRDDAHVHHNPQAPIVAKNPEPPEPRYTPTDRLVRLLAHALQEVLDGEFTADDLARAALIWAHDRPDLGDSTREPRELTAEEMIERIRSIVSTDELPRLRTQVSELTEDMEILRQRATEAEAARDKAQAEYEKVLRDIQIIRDLLPGGTNE